MIPGQIPQHLKREGIAPGQLRHFLRLLRRKTKNALVLDNDGAPVQGLQRNLRRPIQKGQAFFVLQFLDILIQARSQQKNRQILPDKDLKGAGKNLHGFVVRHLINGDQQPFPALLHFLQYFNDGGLRIRDGCSSFDSHPKAEKGKIQLGRLDKTGAELMAVQFGQQRQQKVRCRVQLNDNPVFPFPQLLRNLCHHDRFSAASHSGDDKHLLVYRFRREGLQNFILLQGSFYSLQRILAEGKRKWVLHASPRLSFTTFYCSLLF